MKKLKLNLDDLKIESFVTQSSTNEKGTIHAQETTKPSSPLDPCYCLPFNYTENPTMCGPTCETYCGTCGGDTCGLYVSCSLSGCFECGESNGQIICQ